MVGEAAGDPHRLSAHGDRRARAAILCRTDRRSRRDVDQAAKTVSARIDNVRAAQSQYLLFQQMGVLVYALSATGVAAGGSSQETTLNRLY